MTILRTSVLGLVVEGDDLHAAVVQWGPLGVRSRSCGAIRGFLSLNELERRSQAIALLGAQARSSRLVLVCNPSWCMAKSVGLTPEQWASARSEVIQSIDRLLPLEPSDVSAGLVGVRAMESASGFAGGRLVAARGSKIDEWVEAIEAGFDRHVDSVLSPEMAMLGLGLGDHEITDVIQGEGATAERHSLRRGVPVEFGGSVEGRSDTPRWSISGGAGEDATPIDAGELAVAAALAERVAGDLYCPLRGGRPTRRRAVAAIAAALLFAGLVVGAAGPLREMRVSNALAEVRLERDSLVDAHNALRDVRKETERQARLANAAIEFVNERSTSLEAIRTVSDVLPVEGVLYRLEIDGASLTVSGEAPSVLSVLEELEESALFTDVALTAPLTHSPADDALDVFAIHAKRVGPGGAP